MKKFIFTLLFSTLVFSSPSYAGWTEVTENVSGDTFYVDFDRIRKHDGYVYYWELSDLLKPTKYGDLSNKAYTQVDCKLFRSKYLSMSSYKQPMGNGTPSSTFEPPAEWDYPLPSSGGEFILKSVCNH